MTNSDPERTVDHPDLIIELNDYAKDDGRYEPYLSEASLVLVPREGSMPLTHGGILELGVYKEFNGYLSDCMWPYSLKGQYVEWGIDEQTAKFLEGLVSMLRPQVLLETGTNRGRSTRAILDGLVDNSQGHLWTVDMQDYGLFISGALKEEQHDLVSQVIGKLPGAFEEEPLKDLKNIDFAFIDAGHKGEQLCQDLEYVDAHRADGCWVAVHDTKSNWWHEIPEFMATYDKYPIISLQSMNGLDLIWMK